MSEPDQKPPSRPLKEIALDILRFPTDLPEGVKFDSSMRVKEPHQSSFGGHLREQIEIAMEIIENEGHMSLLDRVQKKPLPKDLKPEVESAELTLAHSVVPMERLQDALHQMATFNTLDERGVQAVRSSAWPLVTTMAKALNETADFERGEKGGSMQDAMAGYVAELHDISKEEALASKNRQSDDSIATFDRAARNLREGVVPLFEELATALNTSLNKGPHVA